KFVTSSGVSAGIDMALHVISRTHGREVRENVARAMEYDWHTDADWDPVAKVWGLVSERDPRRGSGEPAESGPPCVGAGARGGARRGPPPRRQGSPTDRPPARDA